MPSAVLVADPETTTREYIGRQLRDDGFDVLGASRRSEALDIAEQARPDLVLLAELDLCLRLRSGEPGRTWDRNVPVILLAPSSDPVERVRALDRGADDVIARPFAYEELLARIRAVLRRTTTSIGEVLVAGDVSVDRRTRRVSGARAPHHVVGEGVRPARAARGRAASRLHEGRAAARGVGLPRSRTNENARVARLAPTAEALCRRERPLCRKCLGCRVPAARVSLRYGSAPSSSSSATFLSRPPP